jgi:plastocyanin
MRLTLAAAMLAAALAVTAVVVAAGPVSVEIRDFEYGPPRLTVSAGTKVTWTNHDEETHTITSTTGAFGSTGLSHEETFTQTFTRPGTYAYFCALHPQMRATVVVR